MSFETARGIKWGENMVRAQRAPENPVTVDGMRGAVTAVLLGGETLTKHEWRDHLYSSHLRPVGTDTYALGKRQNSPWPSEQGPCKECKTRANPATEQSLRNSGELKREDTK